jgi:hypothetical protein
MDQQASKSPRNPQRAAQYVRMSTEHQQYSTENQSEVIARYAEQHGMEASPSQAEESCGSYSQKQNPAMRTSAPYWFTTLAGGGAFRMSTKVPTMSTSVEERASTFTIARNSSRTMAARFPR